MGIVSPIPDPKTSESKEASPNQTMAYPSLKTGLFFGLFLLSLIVTSEAEEKQPKLSIFNIIKFENNACKGSTRNGTCYTAAECESVGGKKSGDCADGFGVCCIVMLTAGGSTSLNHSYIVQASSCSLTVGPKTYEICPLSTDIRRIRLDFTVFTLAPPHTGGGTLTAATWTGGAVGDCLQDTFVLTSSGGAASPVICGTNTGQHMIIDNDGQGCSVANFNIGGGTFTRAYDLTITQYREGDESGGPMGCLQYFEQESSMIRSFNFPVTAKGAKFVDTVVHLSNQDYNVCIRRAAGKFQICYIQCTVIASASAGSQSSFGLSISTTTASDAMIDSGCTHDYITIPRGLHKITTASTTVDLGKANRFCGRQLATARAATASTSVCSASIPFRLGVHTDADEMTGSGTAENTNEQVKYPGGIIGFQLCYAQS